MEPKNDLDRLALLHGSDKFGSHFYTEIYHDHFERIRNDQLHVLELGIGGYDDPHAGGASLRMWQDYFPVAHIYGLDVFPKHGIADDRVHVVEGSQADPCAIVALLDLNPKKMFDIIIDDGSHRPEHIIPAFMMLFPYLSDGGWYVVEDTETAYWPDYGGVRHNASNRLNTMSFFKQFIDGLNWLARDVNPYKPTLFDSQISSLHFYRNLVFIRRRL
jgi:hypothetical protein